MRHLAVLIVLLGTAAPASAQYRTLNDRLAAREYTLESWQRRAAYLREHILASAGLIPMPEKTPLRAHIDDERRHAGYSISKVYFESLPGFFVTGNLYRPAGAGPFPAVLSPHGHWAYGRLENTAIASMPGRAINLARQGFVVFSYDMIGYNDSRQLSHEFGGRREHLWGLSLAGLQLWNGIRSIDFLESLPDVDRKRIGCTGASGGGTQTFLLAAVDDRIAVAAPVNMISLHMQGGCLCENEPGLRLDTNNLELAATISPRPLLMVAATGDWTSETLEAEYPAMRRIYALFGAEDRVHAVRFEAPHNDNQSSREAVYSWMARWLQGAPADTHVAERAFQPDPIPDALVFYGRRMPDEALTSAGLTERWIASARRQLTDSDPRLLQTALLHALALERQPARPAPAPARTVVLAGDAGNLRTALLGAGYTVRVVVPTPFDAAAAAKVSYFDTYNRTAASQLVSDIAQALRETPSAALVAGGDAALPALLAIAAVPVERAVIDVAAFDNSSDDAFLDRLDIPGIRRAGDLQTAVSMAGGRVTVHNAGTLFKLEGVRIEPRALAPQEIIALLKP